MCLECDTYGEGVAVNEIHDKGGSEQRKIAPRNYGKLKLFIARFWSHDWIVCVSVGQIRGTAKLFKEQNYGNSP